MSRPDAAILELRPVEVRAASTGRRLSGAIRYGEAAKVGGFTERLDPLALQPAADVLLLHQHDAGSLLGRTGSGTLKLVNTADELRFECELPRTRLGDDVRELVERRDLTAASFGFLATRETWSADRRERVIHAADLREISLVALGAYPSAGGLQLRHRDPPPPLNLRLRLARLYLDVLE